MITIRPYRADSFLGALTDPAARELHSVARPRWYADGQVLLHQGDGGSHVLLLRQGTAKVVADTRYGTKVLLGLRGPGDLLGEMRYLRGVPRTATVVASSAVQASVVDFDALGALVRRYPSVLALIARCLADRLLWADRRRADFGLPVPVRIREVLGDLVRTTWYTVPVTQRELGQLVGAAEVTVQRSLRELARRGWLTCQYGRITVARPAGGTDVSTVDSCTERSA